MKKPLDIKALDVFLSAVEDRLSHLESKMDMYKDEDEEREPVSEDTIEKKAVCPECGLPEGECKCGYFDIDRKTYVVDAETKVRYVRDAAYWGVPVLTPITPGMKPQGPTSPAGRARRSSMTGRGIRRSMPSTASGGDKTPGRAAPRKRVRPKNGPATQERRESAANVAANARSASSAGRKPRMSGPVPEGAGPKRPKLEEGERGKFVDSANRRASAARVAAAAGEAAAGGRGGKKPSRDDSGVSITHFGTGGKGPGGSTHRAEISQNDDGTWGASFTRLNPKSGGESGGRTTVKDKFKSREEAEAWVNNSAKRSKVSANPDGDKEAARERGEISDRAGELMSGDKPRPKRPRSLTEAEQEERWRNFERDELPKLREEGRRKYREQREVEESNIAAAARARLEAAGMGPSGKPRQMSREEQEEFARNYREERRKGKDSVESPDGGKKGKGSDTVADSKFEKVFNEDTEKEQYAPVPADQYDKKEILDELKKISRDGRPEATGTVEDPIDVGKDTVRARELLAEGKHIRMDSHLELGTLVEELAAIGKDAEKKGEKAPDYDLCKVSVPGTNLFCQESRGVPRNEMPQFKGVPQPGSLAEKMYNEKRAEIQARIDAGETGPDGKPLKLPKEADIEGLFMEFLEDMGITMEEKRVPSSELKATQDQLVGTQVAGMAGAIKDGSMPKSVMDSPVFVTSDGYVLDGHHRWAALVAIDMEDGKQGDIDMPVRMIGADIGYILDLANAFCDMTGVKRKSGGKKKPTTGRSGDKEVLDGVGTVTQSDNTQGKKWWDIRDEFSKKSDDDCGCYDKV